MRYRKTTSSKGGWLPADMEKAVNDVLSNSVPLKTAARANKVPRTTLKRRVTQSRRNGGVYERAAAYSKTSMKIFSDKEEEELVEYCMAASKMGYGVSTIKLRSLAYEFANKLNKRLPHSRRGRPNPWEDRKEAGRDWLKAFLRRHRNLSIRKPEATSIGRMTAFNHHNVEVFYDNIRSVFNIHSFEPHQIWNCDETGVTTVQIPERVLATRGERQVASVTSGECGTLVTMCNAVSASGISVPPYYIFPRVNFKDIFLKNGTPGCSGTAQPTGWMTEQTFQEWFQHFLKFTQPSTTNPILLILDNHETHMSSQFIDKAKENGVVLVTIPPHTSHKLQPLDISVYGPFKRLFNREMDTWLSNHGGKTVSIYELAEISGKAWIKASMPANIISGFASAGLYPFQPD
jgi:hypothetical protein